MKLTKKQIDLIVENTPQELKGTQPHIIEDLGRFWKSGANWAYRAGYIKYNDINILVITVFGEVQ